MTALESRAARNAFRDTNGSSREIAAYLGDVSYKSVQRMLFPQLLAGFAEGLRTVRFLRREKF